MMESDETLLDKVKNVKTCENKITDEQIKLALAWAKNEVRIIQINKVINEDINNPSGGRTYSMLARAFKSAIQKGILIEKDKL